MDNFFASNLVALRRKNAMSQAQLASAIDKRQTTVSNWENGDTEPVIKDLIKIKQLFGISLEELVLIDLQKGKLIESRGVFQEPQKGKVIGKLMGKVMERNEGNLGVFGEVGEPSAQYGENTLWLVLQELRRNSGKLDQLRTLLDSMVTKDGQSGSDSKGKK